MTDHLDAEDYTARELLMHELVVGCKTPEEQAKSVLARLEEDRSIDLDSPIPDNMLPLMIARVRAMAGQNTSKGPDINTPNLG